MSTASCITVWYSYTCYTQHTVFTHLSHTHTASCISLVIIHLLQHGRFIHLSHTQGILDHLLHTAGYIYIAVTHTEHPVSQPGIHTPVTHSMIYFYTRLSHTHTYHSVSVWYSYTCYTQHDIFTHLSHTHTHTHTHTILYHCLVFIHLLYTQYASSQTGKHSIS